MIKLTFKSYLSLGILAELIILIFFYLISENLGEIFRMSARYSGRLSLIIYLICFYHFTFSFIKRKSKTELNQSVIIFCVLHYIHFIYLALSVYLNDLPIIPSKLSSFAIFSNLTNILLNIHLPWYFGSTQTLIEIKNFTFFLLKINSWGIPPTCPINLLLL